MISYRKIQEKHAAEAEPSQEVKQFTEVKNSGEEYYIDLLNWGKQWVEKYCDVVASVAEDGELLGLNDRMIFGRELNLLGESQITEAQKAEYDDFTKEMMLDMKKILHKSPQNQALEYLFRMYKFSGFEWFMVVMALMPELEPQFERVFCLLQDDYEKKEPTIDFCAQMFSLREKKQQQCKRQVIKKWDMLSNVFAGWVERESAELTHGSIFSMLLKLDERIVRYLFDMQSQDLYFKDTVKRIHPERALSPMLIREELVEKLSQLHKKAQGGFVYIAGTRGIGKKFLVSHYCKQEGKKLLLVNVSKLILEVPIGRQTAKRLIREARMQGDAVLCFDDITLKEPIQVRLLEMILNELDDNISAPIFLSQEKWDVRLGIKEVSCMELELNPVTVEERGTLWKGLLEGMSFEDEIHTSQLADRYQLTPGAIVLAVEEIEKQQMNTEKELYRAAQNQLEHKLGKDAVRVPVQYTMKELILPAQQKDLIKNACNLVEYRHLVYNKWGFGSKMAYGKGVNMIFYGPPGTGKTMGAQAVAGELNMELYRVDMSNVLSKYVGESEKKLGNIFEQGQKSQSILFFDEADALFGKRSEVKDAQDKYANASTAYLLQKIEEYQGVVILATNLIQNFDTAFARRFQFMIQFPMPDQGHRLEIWKSVFPEELPLEEEIDFEYLAEQFVFSGSQIKNIAVASAFLAAGEQKELSMLFILESIKREMKKIGKNMIGNDFGKYCSLMEG